MIVVDFIKVGAEVEHEDSNHLQQCFNYIVARLNKKPSSGHFSRGPLQQNLINTDAIKSLCAALGAPEDPKSTKSRLFDLVSQFAHKMKLQVPEQASSHYLTLAANKVGAHEFLRNTIESNDVKTLERFIDGGGLDEVKSIRFLTKDSNWGLVHTAISSRAINCLKLLLNVSCSANAVLTDGRTPGHLCSKDQDEDSLRILIEHRISTTVQDTRADTVWHLAAGMNFAKILKLLLSLEGERERALRLKSNEGRTPVCCTGQRAQRSCTCAHATLSFSPVLGGGVLSVQSGRSHRILRHHSQATRCWSRTRPSRYQLGESAAFHWIKCKCRVCKAIGRCIPTLSPGSHR
ncbi:hypothetical protein F4678DRAFT_364007 [Xylaria arbuscula]|nr:hypothetical protein F4678DRAFT_364007 [Xylaria arbuscula]